MQSAKKYLLFLVPGVFLSAISRVDIIIGKTVSLIKLEVEQNGGVLHRFEFPERAVASGPNRSDPSKGRVYENQFWLKISIFLR